MATLHFKWYNEMEHRCAKSIWIHDFYYIPTNLIRHTHTHAEFTFGCCNATLLDCTKGSLQSAKHGPINGARKSLYKCIWTKAKCLFLEATCLFMNKSLLSVDGHLDMDMQAQPQKHTTDTLSFNIAGDKIVNDNKIQIDKYQTRSQKNTYHFYCVWKSGND